MQNTAEKITEDDIRAKELRIRFLENEVEFLQSQLKKLRGEKFAPSSEKLNGQSPLFNEAEKESEPKNGKVISVGKHQRKIKKRDPLDPDLPREDVVYEIPEDERLCSCGRCLKEIGEEITELAGMIPQKAIVIRHIRKKYACGHCKDGVSTASMPPLPIPRSNASPGLLAYIVTSKYVDGLPLKRVEELLARAGIRISRSVLANWMIKTSQLLLPIVNLMKDKLLDGHVIYMDETHIQVMKEKGKKPSSKKYMWVQVGGCEDEEIVIFDYDPSRSGATAARMLSGFSGKLVADGYEGYDAATLNRPITLCGCWDHARRYLVKALKGVPKGGDTSQIEKGLELIASLYRIERRYKSVDPEERTVKRSLYSRSIIDHIRKWMDQICHDINPRSLLGQALTYLNRQWHKLTRFVQDGEIEISNQRAENAIRPFVVGRKAWLFADTPAGADASATLYSLVETAKANKIDPWKYLRWVIELAPRCQTLEDYERLLPWVVRDHFVGVPVESI